MSAAFATVLLWGAAIGTGTMAGVFFAFSSFVMRSLAALPREQGIAAMQSINTIILSSSFMPVFFGTTLVGLGLGVGSLVRWASPGAPYVAIGAAVYVVGMFVCTAAANVPLNEDLAAVDPASTEGGRVWAHYLEAWTRWNHVRTAASAGASALFIAGLVAGSGR